MKKIFLLVLFAAAGLSAQAQLSPVNIGAKLGLNYSTLTGVGEIAEAEYRLGFVGGGFVRVNLGKFHIQPEVLYSFKNVTLKASTSNQEFKINQQNLDVPVLLGYSIVDLDLFKLRLQAGPMASFSLSRDLPDEINEDAFEDFIWGFQAGAGVDIANITVDLRYERLFDVADAADLGKPSSGLFQLTVGFKFI